MRPIARAAAFAAVLGATTALGHPGRALGAFPISHTGTFGPAPRPRLAGNRPGKTYKANGPREVARRLRQIARGQLRPVFGTTVPAHATAFQVAA